ncbi:MAG: hypothetical protein JSU01_18655 [Bacteroidetes bacterium]|nr:hypothetical protein [Bacteroidota bacterium]
MKRSFAAVLVALSLFAASCASHKNVITTETSAQSADRDGSSLDKAIIINETHEQPGVDAEYAWLRQKYPGYRSQGQALLFKDDKPFDLIHVLTADGKKIDVYFDISKFYGNF